MVQSTSLVRGHLSCFQYLAVTNGAVVNSFSIYRFIMLEVLSLRYIPRQKIAGSKGGCICRFVTCRQIPFLKGCTSLRSDQQCMRMFISPPTSPTEHVTYFCHQVCWCDFNCLSLAMSKVERFLICVRAISETFLEQSMNYLLFSQSDF